MKSLKLISIRPIQIHFLFDTDRDGIKDRDDCQPFNPMFQDEAENKQKRERYQRPDVKQYHKDYAQRPEVKEKKKKFGKEYRKRPEIKQLMHERRMEYTHQSRERILGDIEKQIQEWERD